MLEATKSGKCVFHVLSDDTYIFPACVLSEI